MSDNLHDIIIPFKRCTKCGNEYPATAEYFYRNKTFNDGLHFQCKKCRNKYQVKYNVEHRQEIKQWRDEHYEDRRRKKSQYNTEHREERKQNKARWHAEHREEQRQVSARYNTEHREEIKQWRKNHKDKSRAVTHRRMARKRSLPNTISSKDIAYALEYFNNRCAVCGRPLNGLWHTGALDHWIPLASPDCPGSIPENEVPLCHGMEGCNNSKCDRDPVEWVTEKYGKRKAASILKRIETYFASLRKDGESLDKG